MGSDIPPHERAAEAMRQIEIEQIQRSMNPMPNVTKSTVAGVNWSSMAAMVGAICGAIMMGGRWMPFGLLLGAIGGAIVFGVPVHIFFWGVMQIDARSKPAGWFKCMVRGAIPGAIIGAVIGVLTDTPVALASLRVAGGGAVLGIAIKLAAKILRFMHQAQLIKPKGAI